MLQTFAISRITREVESLGVDLGALATSSLIGIVRYITNHARDTHRCDLPRKWSYLRRCQEVVAMSIQTRDNIVLTVTNFRIVHRQDGNSVDRRTLMIFDKELYREQFQSVALAYAISSQMTLEDVHINSRLAGN